jgi:exosome complex component CSL4
MKDGKEGPGEGPMVFPGDVVGTTEEYITGSGVFEEGGTIKASRVGQVHVDSRSRRISIKPSTSIPVELRVGDIAIGEIYELRNSMAVVTLLYKEGFERPVSSNSLGTLYISKISQDYLDDIHDAFHIGDVVRARVIQAEPSVQLECVADDLGVILAKCPLCKDPLEDRRSTAGCPRCEIDLKKKLSSKYRRMNL